MAEDHRIPPPGSVAGVVHLPGTPATRFASGPVGLVRDRLSRRLSDAAAYRVGWIAAPAGTGKSRLLAHVARAFPGPVAWCGSPNPAPRSEEALCGWLWDGLGGPAGRPPATVEELLAVVPAAGEPMLIVLDDVHLLEGAEAEEALGRVIANLPDRWRLLMASRVKLAFDLSRMRVSGAVVDIGPEDLRFRAWEVEALFREVYREPLQPEEVAALARRTSGWAAYLQMFFLATTHKPRTERRLVLGSLKDRTRLISEYLVRHVLADLDPALQDFLLRSSPLRRPTAAICDEFLGAGADSAARLAELERRQLFTERLIDDSYRYHSVLLAYLDAKLVETIGLSGAKAEHRRAGQLLEREGLTEEALAAYARSEDWAGMARVLGPVGASTTATVPDEAWIEVLPPEVLASDPLLLMVQARTAVARGALEEAVRVLRQAEAVAASAAVVAACRLEREKVTAWVDPAAPVPADWSGLIRRAVVRRPLEARVEATALAGVGGRLAEAVSAALAGDLAGALPALRAVAGDGGASPALAVLAESLAALIAVPLGRSQEVDVITLREDIDSARLRWLGRVARAVLAIEAAPDDSAVDDLLGACERVGDRWGGAAVALLHGLHTLDGLHRGHGPGGPTAPTALTNWPDGSDGSGRPTVPADGRSSADRYLLRAADAFGALGAGTLEALALSYAALATLATGRNEAARLLAGRARSLAATLDVPGAGGVASMVLGRLQPDGAGWTQARDLLAPLGTWDWHAALAVQAGPSPAAATAGLSVPAGLAGTGLAGTAPAGTAPAGTAPPGSWPPGSWPAGSGPAPDGAATDRGATGPGPLRLRCLGGWSLEVGGRTVDESAAKPMERALLHLLSVRAGQPTHREVLIAALWPDAGYDVGRHRLQVAVSAVRRLLDRAGVDGSALVARSGDAYVLAVGEDAEVDLLQFRHALSAAAGARQAGDEREEAEHLARAVYLYRGPLMPGDGPAEWVLEPRRALLADYTDATARLAALMLTAGDASGASRVARAGLAADRYRDDLWKTLIEAAEAAGNHAGAERARKEYEGVLAELGIQ